MSQPQILSQKQLDYHETHRMNFSSKLEFFLTTLGFAAGFGSVWRFPYLVFKNGGGAFMIPYFILMFTLGIPIFYLEICVGQMYKKGPPDILKNINPKYKGIGLIGIVISFVLATYYNLIMAYSIYFFTQSFIYPLPWKQGLSQDQIWSPDYFYKEVLNISGSINQLGELQVGLFVCYCISQTIVYFCIKGGVELSGKVAKYTSTAPYIILLILLTRGLFLEGASSGLYYLFVPDIQKLFDPMVWVDAANQVIFQFSIGTGVLVLYGSYRQNFMIPFMTMICGLIGGLVVFSYIGYISQISNIPISEIPLSGPDLAFIIYPATLSEMSFSNFWSVLFFLVMILLGIDTQFGFVDAVSGTIEDEYLGEIKIFGKSIGSETLRLLICIVISLFGLIYCSQAGFYYLEFVDNFNSKISFFICILAELYFYCVDPKFFKNLKSELEKNKNKIPSPIYFFLQYVDIYLIILLMVFATIQQINLTKHYTVTIALIGWIITLIPIAFALKYYIYPEYDKTIEKEGKELELELIQNDALKSK